ncbi:MAG TPA: hypothetical protein VEJ86_00230 [Candidatus Binataceae bacterium]|nr:hypothetical protein [Candidatus Binataceae bacterium]
MLDETGAILANHEGQRRFDTFPEGNCPVLEALSRDAERDHRKVLIMKPVAAAANGSRKQTPGDIYPWARRATPVFFSLPRLR